MTVRTLPHVFADGNQSLVAKARRPSINAFCNSQLSEAHIRAIGPRRIFVIGVVNRTDHGHARQSSPDAPNHVCGPEMTVNYVRPVRAQPGEKVLGRAR